MPFRKLERIYYITLLSLKLVKSAYAVNGYDQVRVCCGGVAANKIENANISQGLPCGITKYAGHSLVLMVGATTLSNELTSQPDPYYIEGDLTIDAPWSIGPGASLV